MNNSMFNLFTKIYQANMAVYLSKTNTDAVHSRVDLLEFKNKRAF